MAISFSATGGRRKYNRWVANETMEDFALRYTARRARRWSYGRVANTALGSISFLALEAIGGALTLIYGFDAAIIAIMLAGLILFLTCLPISYYGARYGVDIDLLTRGAGFGYIGSTITSLIYATFTFIFFALEAAILAFALDFCFGVPLGIGYLVSAVVVIPLVVNGFSKISTFQTWTQPFWVVLHILPFALLAYSGVDLGTWTQFTGQRGGDGPTIMMIGAAMGVVLSLIAQIGEQVDFLRFLREPRTPAERRKWWLALLAAGPGWTVLGVAKMLAGSFLLVLAIDAAVPPRDATDPTKMYFTAFDQVITLPFVALALTGAFVILSQLKINVTNAYAGSIAWSNFFSRITHSHPGRVIWLVFNVSIALMLMELGVFHVIESILGLYSHVALAWIGALTADLVVNKPLGLSPKGIEFRRAHLYDINPVGTGAMLAAVLVSILVLLGGAGTILQPFSALIALATAFVVAPLIAWGTGGKYYIARPDTAPQPTTPEGAQTCCVCEYRFDREDMTDCPFYAGPICSLCCTLDASCRDSCKPHATLGAMWMSALRRTLPQRAIDLLTARLSVFFMATAVPSSVVAGLLLLIRARAQSEQLDAVLTIIFCTLLVVNGIVVWTLILFRESHHKARDEAEFQTQRLLREIRAHDRTDAALQAAKEKAEAANLAKTRYMAGISHELRTPLNAIYGYAQLLEQDRDMPAGRREAVLAIRRGSEHLAALIENLLDISKIEAGRLEIYRDRINLPELLRQIAAVFKRQAREKGLDFGIQTSGNPPEWIEFDEKRLRQIIINLLSNAINYTPQGTVTLHLHYRNEVARIEVSDTGTGIEEGNLERIWKPFERFSTSSPGGSGLGLTITRLLVDILGGEITVDSVPGEGTTFSVRLMLPSLRESAIPSAAWNMQERAMAVGYVGVRKTVMVVDDDMNHLRLLEATLKPLGFLVQAMPCGEDALKALEDVTPDLFVLDIDMPGMTGWELAQALRDRPAYRSTPIMMVTGHALEARQSIDREQLYDAFIVKPYSLSDFLARMAGLLKVELTTEAPETEAGPAAGIPDDALARMIRLAEIGHAAGIARELDAMTAGTGPESGQVARVRRHLEVFDLPGIARILKEMMQDAA
ncbi:MAG: ATP-binding protein [Roseovarius confluentis]|jgi:signal transduction histidine kinase/purine-cytosine permease-like protein/ActR/RegA family two-component response regulator|uniref:hybrid sensor histidine kinase/response regulator n=1 Tax=Roseovarius TaxID=74030 RepID=UPI000CDD89CC|nr:MULTISPECIES: ATP-binding protein [Roseovarius]